MFLNKSLIAIDVGSSSVKIVELTGTSEKKLRAIGLEKLPVGAVVNGVIQNPEAVEKVTKSLIKKLKILTTGRKAAIAIGGGSVIIKKVGFLPASSQEEFTEQVYYEAEQHFQHDVEELEIDYFELSNTPGEDGMIPVLLVGAKKEMIEQYLALVRSVGMRTAVIDCDVFAVANMFEHNFGASEGLISIINVGSDIIQVSLIGNGQYLFTRDIPYGGHEYTHRIMEIMGISKEEAEEMKISASNEMNGSNQVVEIISAVNEQLVSEIRMTVEYYFQSGELPETFERLDNVFITGGGAKILGFDAALAASLQVPVQIINPFHRIDVNPKKFQSDYIFSQGHMYGTAVGLAMRALKDTQN